MIFVFGNVVEISVLLILVILPIVLQHITVCPLFMTVELYFLISKTSLNERYMSLWFHYVLIL